MRIARFSHNDAIRYGIVDDGDLVVLAGDPLFAGFETTGERVPLADAALLAPVIPRSKVVCVGKNYHDHAAEMGGEAPAEPLLFLKPNTAVIGPGDVIVRPRQSQRTDFEGELAVVIGRVAKDVAAADALGYVFGFTVANDALQLLGGYGYLHDYGIEKLVRDLRVHQILEGTNEIMRVIVARHLIGR